ncbi:MAG: hypothetical protein ACKOGM_07480, partial [Solirubrobacterales bacterium]
MRSFEVQEESTPTRSPALGPARNRLRGSAVALLAASVGLAGLALAPQASSSPGAQPQGAESRQAQGRIVNGTIAPEGSWPSIAQLFPANSQCGGTLIDRYT